ncbi:MAG: FAD-binding oxidoreductase [Pseudomonadota bacterium]
MNEQELVPTGKPQSLWAATAGDQGAHQHLAEILEVDVTIVGAGFTGLRAALKLAEAGLKTVVMDAGDVGYGASGRNGGQVNPMLPFNTPEKLTKLLGNKYFERLTEASLGSADELFSVIKKYQIECKARQNGWLRVCHSSRALKDAEAGVAEWNKHGAGMSIIDQDEVERLSGTQAYQAGVLTPKGGAVQPMLLANGLANAAKQRGCKIFGNSPVQDVKQADGKWVAKTEHGSVTSDWIIVATNGYTGDLIPRLSTSIIPVTPIQIATDPLPESVVANILPEGHTISDSRRIIMYARREADNRMVYGGHGKMLPSGEIHGVGWLTKDAVRVFPQLKDVKWSYKWGGRIAITDDHLPHLHEPKPGLLIGLGYNGRGVAMSNVMGRVMAERVLGKSVDELPFPNTAIKDFSLRSIKLAGMSSAIWFMRLLDYLETR